MKKLILFITITAMLSACANTQKKQDPYGGRSMEQIQSSFDKHSKAIFAIYEKELKVDPDLNGKINFMIAIQRDGEVSNCSSDQKENKIGLLANRICTHILIMSFGKGKEINLPYVIDFIPE